MLILSALLMAASAKFPHMRNGIRRRNIPSWWTLSADLTGLLPFSAAEICLYLLLCGLAVSAVLAAAKIVKGGRASAVLNVWFSKVILAVSVLALLYTVGCGINYRRNSSPQRRGSSHQSTAQMSFEKICVWLTEEVNARAEEVPRDGQGVMELSGPEGEGAAEAWKCSRKNFLRLKGIIRNRKR